PWPAAHPTPASFPTRRSSDLEGRSVQATVEGVVPAEGGNLYRVNALVPNPVTGASTRDFLAGSAATLELPAGSRNALVVPVNARSEEHTSELQSREKLVCRLL